MRIDVFNTCQEMLPCSRARRGRSQKGAFASIRSRQSCEITPARVRIGSVAVVDVVCPCGR